MDIKSLRGYNYIELANQFRKEGIYPFFRAIESSEGTSVQVDGKDLIMIGSNNYLGLTHHPKVKEAAVKAIEKYGTGCTGSRLLNGNLNLHEELELKLAKYLGHEKALVFATGMQTNLGALSSVCGPRDCMIFDSENHASILDASRLSFGKTLKYKHNNMESLEETLIQAQGKFRNIMIVADGVFSMTGDILKLPEVSTLAKKYNADIYVDDAHGLGVMGPKGSGTMNHFGLAKDVFLNMGTFSKSFSSIGGVISGNADIVDYIKHNARSFIFSAAMPPSAVATVNACLDVINEDDSVFTRLWDNVKFITQSFKDIGLYTYDSQTPIVPVLVGDDLKALKVTAYLKEQGLFSTPVISPGVPKGEALIRTSYMATHTREQLTKVVEIFAKAKKEFNLPSTKEQL